MKKIQIILAVFFISMVGVVFGQFRPTMPPRPLQPAPLHP
jgi:hypothetical protein